MEKRLFKGKVLPVTACALMTVSSLCTVNPVFAAGTNYDTSIGGTKTTTFDKYLVMDADANVPNAAFTYSVAAGSAKSYDVDGKKFEILAGVDADKVVLTGTSANTVEYVVGDTTLQDENALVKNYDSSTEKYASKTVTVDFSACQFTEPGVYRYVITESGENQAITNDAETTRFIDVYVDDASDDSAKKLSVAGYVLHTNEDDIAAGDDAGTDGEYTGTKSQGFTNEYDTSDLVVRKEVSGNQASRDKYFEFTVNITDAVPGTVYDVDLSNADTVSASNAATIEANTGKTNPASLTVGDDGTVTQKFYLQHGQQIKIMGVAKDSQYNVTENAEDYKSTAAGVSGYTDAVSAAIASSDVNTSYMNTRSGIIPTGLATTVTPFAVLTLVGGAGAVSVLMNKNKKKME